MRADDPHRYDDIINLPHPASKTHPPLSMAQRAAQFSPFAALTGYDEAAKETARLTDKRIELSEEEMSVLDGKLQMLQEHIDERPEVAVTYFLPDKRKDGGSYVTMAGAAKKIDSYRNMLVMIDGTEIPIKEILSIKRENVDE